VSDPISRLAFAVQEIDRVFGDGYARAHPDVVASVMQSAAIDFAALALARALQDIARALAVEDEQVDRSIGIVRASPGLVR
jgi:hypothetical protein